MIVSDVYINGTLVYATKVVLVPKIVYPTEVYFPAEKIHELEVLKKTQDTGTPIIKPSYLLWDDDNEVLFDDNTNIKI